MIMRVERGRVWRFKRSGIKPVLEVGALRKAALYT